MMMRRTRDDRVLIMMIMMMIMMMQIMIMIEKIRVFFRVGVFQQNTFVVSCDVLMLIGVFDRNEFFVAFEVFVQSVLLVAAAGRRSGAAAEVTSACGTI